MDTCYNVHLPKWIADTSTCPNEHLLEWTIAQMDFCLICNKFNLTSIAQLGYWLDKNNKYILFQ